MRPEAPSSGQRLQAAAPIGIVAGMNPLRLGLVTLSVCLGACRSTSDAQFDPPMDPHSFSDPNRVRVTHVMLDLDLDFDAEVARGSVVLQFERFDPAAPLVLDTMGLRIADVTGTDRQSRDFTLGAGHQGFGRPLSIDLHEKDTRVIVHYETTPQSEAMQWLAPSQTAGGEKPFLFTQGQAILTRSWIPLQDSPGVRVTYEARVRAPEGLRAVMSAEFLEQASDGAWVYKLDKPIPPYLIALACGELESRAISHRCAVWSEPSVVEIARTEFEDTERMVQQAERLFGPYRWGRYDIIVLPPAFPYGGMENPLLTFMTPTAIAGDRSLVSIVAHELAHSWSGNLVTNATWSDFWLNEGFTVYFEKRIMEALYGQERAQMEALIGFHDLTDAMQKLEPWATVLHIDLLDRHPDDGFSIVPYEKGALFLARLEELFGRQAFDIALTKWFNKHAFQSVTTEDFVTFLEAELFFRDASAAAEVDLETWLEGPGLPEDAPRPASNSLALVDRELELLAEGAAPARLATEGWVTQQWVHFLSKMPDSLSAQLMSALDDAFGFTSSGNSEILCKWLELTIQNGYQPAFPRLETFLRTVGRRKYLQPLYEELAKSERGLARARTIYASARRKYHAVSAKTLDKVLYKER